MDQLKSSSSSAAAAQANYGGASLAGNGVIPVPRRSFSVEFFVGLFTLACVAAGGYLAIGLGDFRFMSPQRYEIRAEFDNIAGLKTGASVEIAGVQVGEVTSITLNDPVAQVILSLDHGVRIRDDDIASIRTKGIIGDRYVKISRGGSDMFLAPGSKLTETESAVDIEDVIGKIVHSLSADEPESAPEVNPPK